MSECLYKDKGWLIDNYRFTSKSRNEIADMFDIGYYTIYDWTQEHDIEKLHKDEDWLREKYRVEGLTGKEIANSEVPYDVKEEAVQRQIRKYGIERVYKDKDWLKERYVSREMSGVDIAEQCVPHDVSSGSVQRYIRKYDLKRNYQKESWLREKYVGTDNSMKDVAEMVGVSTGTIYNNMKKCDIETVSVANRWDVYDNPLEGVTGEDHPLYDPDRVNQDWRHSAEWREVKKQIRDIYANTCTMPDCNNSGWTHVHHICPVRRGGDKFSFENLTVACVECHCDMTGSGFYSDESCGPPEVEWIDEENKYYT